MTELDNESSSNNNSRSRNGIYRFTDQHPLYTTHVQQIYSKFVLPAAGGGAPPKAHSLFYLLALRPWDFTSFEWEDYTWEKLQSWKRSTCVPTASCMQRAANCLFHRHDRGFGTSAKQQKLSNQYRGSGRIHVNVSDVSGGRTSMEVTTADQVLSEQDRELIELEQQPLQNIASIQTDNRRLHDLAQQAQRNQNNYVCMAINCRLVSQLRTSHYTGTDEYVRGTAKPLIDN